MVPETISNLTLALLLCMTTLNSLRWSVCSNVIDLWSASFLEVPSQWQNTTHRFALHLQWVDTDCLVWFKSISPIMNYNYLSKPALASQNKLSVSHIVYKHKLSFTLLIVVKHHSIVKIGKNSRTSSQKQAFHYATLINLSRWGLMVFMS